MTAAQRAGGRLGVARSLWAGALVLPLSGVLLVVAAPPASAQIGSPETGTVFAAHDTFLITANQFGASRLLLTPPGGQAIQVAEGGPADLEVSHPFNTLCREADGRPCAGDRPAANGEWGVRQVGGGVSDSSTTFRLRIPARPPTDVTADGSSPLQASVSWRLGTEPDLTGFAVFEGETQVKSVPRGDCRDGACTAVIAYPVEGAGAHTYTVRAFRSAGDGGEPLASAPSASASATVLPGAALPGPLGGVVPGTGSPAPESSASASPSPAKATASRSPAARPGGVDPAAARRQAFSTGFNTFGPKLGVPKLPPLPQAPAVAQLPDGTFEPTLGFEDQELGEDDPSSGVAARVTSTVGDAIVSEQVVRSTAGALVLLLTGAHLRRWLNAAPPE